MRPLLTPLLLLCLFLGTGIARAQEGEPNDSFADATTVSCGQTLLAFVNTSTDVDFFQVTVPANAVLQAIVGQGTCSGGPRDAKACRLPAECPVGVCQLQGTCRSGPQMGNPCTAPSDCVGSICETAPDLELMGFSADQMEQFFIDKTLSSEDPVVTTPIGYTTDDTFFLKVFPITDAGQPASYQLSVECPQPQELTCPHKALAVDSDEDTFVNDFEGDLDVFRLTDPGLVSPLNDTIERPRRIILDVGGDPNGIGFDAVVRLYDRNWNVLKEVFNLLGPTDDPNTFFGFDELDAYLAMNVFDPPDPPGPGTAPPEPYYAAVTCAEDDLFLGCLVDRVRALDSQYSIRRRCKNINNGASPALDPAPVVELKNNGACPATPTSIDALKPFAAPDRLKVLAGQDHTQVHYLSFDVQAGDRIRISPNPGSEIEPVVGLFKTTGQVVDGQPVVRGPAFGTISIDEFTCEGDSTACKEFFDPSRQISYCATETEAVVLGITNFLDLDFNGLDDANGGKDLIVNWEQLGGDPNHPALGRYEFDLSCDRPDTDGDGVTDCLDPSDCGNGFPEGPEECDDGNQTPGDGCEPDCTLTPPDTDGDGIPDAGPAPCQSGQTVGCADNCRFERNNGGSPQTDTDGNGRGDACECGNADGSTGVDIFDALHIAQGTLTPPLVTIIHPRACDADGSGSCTIFDALRVAQATLTPPLAEIAQQCSAATSPRKR